jgi:hypothetical protein
MTFTTFQAFIGLGALVSFLAMVVSVAWSLPNRSTRPDGFE